MRWLYQLIPTLFVFICTPSIALAHATPIGLNPADNASLDTPPETVTITFNEAVVPALSDVTILSSTGEQIPVGEIAYVEDGELAEVPLPSLSNGAYLVSWRVTSAVDGHNTTGTYSFGVGTAALSTAKQITFWDQILWLTSAIRTMRIISLVMLIGAFGYQLFVARTETAVKTASFALITLLIAALITFGYQVGQHGTESISPWLGTTFGRMWLFRLILVAPLIYFIQSIVKQRDENEQKQMILFAFLLSLVLTLTNALGSHSAALSDEALRGTMIDLSHTAAAGLWAGGLILLIADLRGKIVNQPERIMRFSTMALMAMAGLFITGGWLGWKHVGSWTALVGTTYGLLLLLKMALLIPVMAIAAYNLFVIGKKLKNNRPIPKFKRIVTIEGVLALLILGAAGFISDSQRAIHAPMLTAEAGRTTLTTTADNLIITADIEPALIGNNTFSIIIEDSNGDPVTDAEEVAIRFTYLDQSLGSNDGVAEHQGNGVYSVEGGFITLIGDWQMEVKVVRPDIYDTFAPYRLTAGITSDIRAIDAGSSVIEQFGSFMILADKAGTGILLILLAVGWAVAAARGTDRVWQTVPMLVACAAVMWLGISQTADYYENEFTPGKFQTNPILPDSSSIAQGKALWETMPCATCHGLYGEGDGAVANSLPIPPANFGDGHTAIHTDGDLFYWIAKGKNDGIMPAWETQLSDEEMWHLVNYVRRLATVAEAEYNNNQ